MSCLAKLAVVAATATWLFALPSLPEEGTCHAAGAYRIGGPVAGEDTIRAGNVEFSSTGVPEEYARAMARVAAAAHRAAVEKFGFKMPKTLHVGVIINAKALGGRKAALWTDGRDRIGLMLKSEECLRKPAMSRPHVAIYFGPSPIYWLCQQVGAVALDRAICQRDWMTATARLGWREYLGSRLVDEVYAREGKDLWPDPYDYRDFGIKYLRKKLDHSPSAETKAASLWEELVKIVSDKHVAPIFEAWSKIRFDPADPERAVSDALMATATDKRVADWWNRARGVFVVKPPARISAS